jgi:hypothetical protein
MNVIPRSTEAQGNRLNVGLCCERTCAHRPIAHLRTAHLPESLVDEFPFAPFFIESIRLVVQQLQKAFRSTVVIAIATA